MRLVTSIALIATTLCHASGFAQQPQTVRLRGTITNIDGENLTVTARPGEEVKVRLAENARISALVKANVADLKPNTFVGVTSVPTSDGGEKAVEVHIFPEERRGTGEGRNAWDLLPDSKMTNGAVNLQVGAIAGQVMSVTYKGQEAKIGLTPETVIAAYAPGDRSELKPGTKVLIFGATRSEDGTLQAPAVTYGRDGFVPPM